MSISSFLALFFVVILYFIPSVVSYSGKRKNSSAILILNIFLGWTILGWIVALIWACIKD